MRRATKRRRFGQAGIATAAVVVGTLVFGVALALVLVQITGTVSSNEFIPTTTTSSTTTTTIPQGDGLEAGISTSGTGFCLQAINAGNLTLGSITFNLNNTSMQSYSPSNILCVTNVGPGPIGTLDVAAVPTGSAEVSCSANEETVDPEGAGCGTDGELVDVIQVVLQPVQLQSGCRPSTILLTPGGSSDTLVGGGSISQGAVCSWEVLLRLSPTATHDEKLAASTDDVFFTLDVSGSA